MKSMILAFAFAFGLCAIAADSELVWTKVSNSDGTQTYTATYDGHALKVENNPRYPAEWHSEVDGSHWCGPFSSLGEAKAQALDSAMFEVNDVDTLMYKGHRIDAVPDTSGYYYNYMIDFKFNRNELYFETRLTAVLAARHRIDSGDLPKAE